MFGFMLADKKIGKIKILSSGNLCAEDKNKHKANEIKIQTRRGLRLEPQGREASAAGAISRDTVGQTDRC